MVSVFFVGFAILNFRYWRFDIKIGRFLVLRFPALLDNQNDMKQGQNVHKTATERQTNKYFYRHAETLTPRQRNTQTKRLRNRLTNRDKES